MRNFKSGGLFGIENDDRYVFSFLRKPIYV